MLGKYELDNAEYSSEKLALTSEQRERVESEQIEFIEDVYDAYIVPYESENVSLVEGIRRSNGRMGPSREYALIAKLHQDSFKNEHSLLVTALVACMHAAEGTMVSEWGCERLETYIRDIYEDLDKQAADHAQHYVANVLVSQTCDLILTLTEHKPGLYWHIKEVIVQESVSESIRNAKPLKLDFGLEPGLA